jgi:tRNA threonylcarbamoyladenosine biosynthesis protein TsaE
MTREREAVSGSEVVSGSVEETLACGERLGRLLRAGDVVALSGDLGSGKTTLIQGIARGLGRDPQAVKSPTFVLLREHPGAVPLVHVDGYRLEGAAAASWLDLDLVFSPHKITVIEWAERFAAALPEHRLEVRLSHVSANRRRVRLVPVGPRAAEILAQLSAPAAGAPATEGATSA